MAVFQICEGPDELRKVPAFSCSLLQKFRLAITAPSQVPVHCSTGKASCCLVVVVSSQKPGLTAMWICVIKQLLSYKKQ